MEVVKNAHIQSLLVPRYLTWFANGLIVWFCATLISTPFGAGVTQAVLLAAVLLGGYWLWKYRSNVFHDTQWVLIGLFLAAALNAFLSVYHGFNIRMLHQPALLSVCILAIGLWVLLKPSSNTLWVAMGVGAIAACSLALYQLLVQHNPRPNGWHNAILFGDIAMVLGLMLIAGVIASFEQKQSIWLKMFLLIGVLSGITASLLSGSRGGWLALVLCFIPLYLYTRSWKLMGTALVSIATLVAIVFVTPQTRMRDRLIEVQHNLQEYKNGNAMTSIGARIEMSRAGLMVWLDNPLLGVGNPQFQQKLLALIETGKIQKIPVIEGDYKDTHNEITDAAAKGGILGLLVILLLYGVPLSYFLRILKGNHAQARPIALSGALLVFATIDFGLSVNIFTRHIGKAYYFIFLSILIGLCSSAMSRPQALPK